MKKIIFICTLAFTIESGANEGLKETYLNTMVDFAKVLVCEAGNQGKIGMTAVANVIHNRVINKSWPNDYRSVINQRHQFECMQKKVPVNPKNPSLVLAIKIANDQILGNLPIITEATHYHADWMKKYPYWSKKLIYVSTIGNHIFYK